MTERPASLARLTRGFPLWLLAVATFGFIWLVTPFFSTILWAVIVSVLFAPLNRRLTAKMPQWPGSAALITLLVILAVVVLPAMLLGFAILEELAGFHARLRADQIDLGQIAMAAQSHLPRTVRLWLSEFGLGDITTIRSRLNQNLAGIVQPAVAQIVYFGQGTLGFFLGLGVMLYLTFFLLRDGGSQVSHRKAGKHR